MTLTMCKTVSFGDDNAFYSPPSDENTPSEDEVETPRKILPFSTAESPTVGVAAKPFLTPILKSSHTSQEGQAALVDLSAAFTSATTFEPSELAQPPAYCPTRVKYTGSPDVCLKRKPRPASTPHILMTLCGLKPALPVPTLVMNAVGQISSLGHPQPGGQ